MKLKWLWVLLASMALAACGGFDAAEQGPKRAVAQIGIVNHTGNYIHSASVDGAGGANMSRWGAGGPDVCCTSIPWVWYPGMKVLVRWNMPEGIKDVIREKVVEVERYEEPGSIYLHFFPDDEVRVVVSPVGPRNPDHPIPLPVKPANFNAPR